MRQTRNTHTAQAFYVRPTPLSEAEKADLGAARRIVRIPELNGAIMPAEGAWVQPTAYWQLALQEGSVERCAAPAVGMIAEAPAQPAPSPRPASRRSH